ncbi:MCE family protein [Gordonia terrae]|uniref:MCE family protein n=1 Tax=Gordonia terrae TaxID=2055 RepID=A0A2I1R1H9_9ACTN|nr:MlaD family protein [Gordonia terrae]PKZ62951.1 MCE family protein [Gordonia terrae]
MALSKKAGSLAGVVILVVVGLVVTGMTRVEAAESQPPRDLCAYFSDTMGLYVGNPVTQMGYEIGTVDSVEPDGDRAKVSFDLSVDRALPADVRAVIRAKSLLADRSVELVGNYAGGERLESGQCIDLTRTATPKSLSEITGSASDFLEALSPEDTDDVAGAVDGLEEALRGQGDNVFELMTHAVGAMANPDKMVADVGSIITNMAPFTTTTLENWSTAKQLLAVMPEDLEVASSGLWDGVTTFIDGLGPLLAVLYDVQSNYGEDINTALGFASVGLRIAATRSDDIKELFSGIPVVADLVSGSANAPLFGIKQLSVDVQSPDGPGLCRALNAVRPASCTVVDQRVRLSGLSALDGVLAGVQK